jgi:hypothetical protein
LGEKLGKFKRGMDVCIGGYYIGDKASFLAVKKELVTGTYACRCAQEQKACEKKSS